MWLLTTYNLQPAGQSPCTSGWRLTTCLPAGRAKKRAFTLIEILVVVAIIGILAAIVILMLDKAQSRSRDSRRIADLNTIAQAISLYRENNDTYEIRNAAGEGGQCYASPPPPPAPPCFGYGYFNLGNAFGYLTSINDVLIEGGYLSGTVKDPRGGTAAGSLGGYYTYDYDMSSPIATLGASIWCVLENPTTETSASIGTAVNHESNPSGAVAYEVGRGIADNKINYAVTLKH